jgi:hypothetical protein
MPPASIAAAEQRVIQSRRELRGRLRRVGARLAWPPSLLAAATAGALVGFSLTRLGGAGALARGLAAAALRHGTTLYVRYRAERSRASAEDGAMSTPTPQMRTLARALKDCGGEAALAKALGVAAADLARWLSGQVALPMNVYFKALDLVATRR